MAIILQLPLCLYELQGPVVYVDDCFLPQNVMLPVESQICIFSIHFSIPFHSPKPPKLSISLYINCKRASNIVFNYIFVSVVWFRFCSFSCGILPLPAATTTFRSYFVKLYVTGVYRRNEPHGQVKNDVDMVRVLLVRANSSKEAAVKGIHMEVNHRVSRWQDSVSCHVKVHMAIFELAEDKSTSVHGSIAKFKHPLLIYLLCNTAMILDPWT